MKKTKSNQFELPSFWTTYNDELLKEIVCMKRAKSYLEMSEEGKRQLELIVQNKFKSN